MLILYALYDFIIKYQLQYYILMIIIDFILMHYLKDRNIMAIFTVVYLLIISIFSLYNLGIAIFILFLYIYLKSKRLY